MSAAEDFFPMGWDDRLFRRKPSPDMTYGEALGTAIARSWNMTSEDAHGVWEELSHVLIRMQVDHAQFEGRSTQNVSEFGELWRGKVSTLLTWFQKSGGTA